MLALIIRIIPSGRDGFYIYATYNGPSVIRNNRKKIGPDLGDFLSLVMTVEVVLWRCEHSYAKEEFKND